MTQELFDAQTALISASAAFFGGEDVRLIADFPLLAAVCNALRGVCEELATLTPADDATYTLREGTLKALSLQYQAGMSTAMDDKLKALQFNGVEIDTELIRIFFYGQNLLALPNP